MITALVAFWRWLLREKQTACDSLLPNLFNVFLVIYIRCLSGDNKMKYFLQKLEGVFYCISALFDPSMLQKETKEGK